MSGKYSKRKLIIDCDPGTDDAQAILMALASNDVEIVAITTVSGNTSAANATKNVLRLLKITNRLDVNKILPLYYITLHHITLHYITLHYITLHYITLQYITSHHITSHHITSHHITSHYITSHHVTSHYITLHYITLHYITLHYITLHYITLHQSITSRKIKLYNVA